MKWESPRKLLHRLITEAIIRMVERGDIKLEKNK